MMKSFGARLGVGAVTILLGAFAAAQAQKDRQNTASKEWVATTPPSLGQPPSPLAAVSGPDSRQNPSTSSALAQAAGAFSSSSAVQLVQHTEEVPPPADQPEEPETNSLELPAFNPGGLETSGEPTVASTDVPNWALPENESPPPSAEAPALSMSLPVAAGAADAGDGTIDSAEMPDLPLGAGPTLGLRPESNVGVQTVDSTLQLPNEPQRGSIPQTYPNALRDEAGLSNPMRNPLPSTATANPMPGPNQTTEIGVAAPTDITFGSGGSLSTGGAPAPVATSGSPALDIATGLGQPTPINQSAVYAAQPSAVYAAQPSAVYAAQPQAINQTAIDPTGPTLQQGPAIPSLQGSTAPTLAAPPMLGSPTVGQRPSGAGFASSPQAGIGDTGTLRQGSIGPAARVAALPNPNFQQSQAGLQATNYEQSAGQLDPTATHSSPGDRRLEGAQSPSVIIQKRAPAEVKVGKPASFVIHVQNVGSAEALDVTVYDRIPRGMRLIDASPAPVMQGDMLLWQLGAMAAGDERTVTMQLIPEQEGELGSVARVSFEAAASVRTISTRPELKIVQRAPEKVLIGQQLEIELEVSNPGSGEATGVILQEDVPDGLEHPKGRQLDNRIGTLAPGEKRRQVLRLRAVTPGVVENRIQLLGDDGLADEHVVAVQVVAPELKIGLVGPAKRFLERQATYQLQIANVGTAPATNVEIAVQLDRGFTFVSTDNQGQYDPTRHTVFWSLAQLPEGGSGAVPLTLLPVEEGQRAINIEARADLGAVAKSDRSITVDAFAELDFQITNPGGPIEIGSETAYEIKVQNTGTKNDTNVRMQLQLPPALELISADGDAETDGRGLVVFRPRPQLAAGGEATYRVRVRGVAPGTHLVKAVVISDQLTVPVTKEESTRVYADH